MEINESDDFEVIDSQYELIESTKVDESKLKAAINYEVVITPTKNQVDLNFVENQYYQFQIHRKGQFLSRVERRFSEFELMFEMLSKKQAGFIFPAFPANGLFAFMKSKVSLSKDEEFVKRRTKMISRFFNLIVNNPLFDPQNCSEMKIFLSPGKEFQARKQIQKGNRGYFNMGWNKLKTYFTIGKQNKYSDVQAKISVLKSKFQSLYAKCRQLMDCLREEYVQNSIFLNNPLSTQKLPQYIKLAQKHDQQQRANSTQLQDLQFLLFCENQDLLMVDRIFARLSELRDDEDNYAEIKSIEESLDRKLDTFIEQKQKIRKTHQLKLKWIIDDIKSVGRIN